MIWDWLIYSIPWEIKAAVAALLAAFILYILGSIFGWEKVKGWVVPVIGVIAALGLANRAQQQGFNARKAQEDQAAKKADEVVTKQRTEINAMPDDELHRETDRWSK